MKLVVLGMRLFATMINNISNLLKFTDYPVDSEFYFKENKTSLDLKMKLLESLLLNLWDQKVKCILTSKKTKKKTKRGQKRTQINQQNSQRH